MAWNQKSTYSIFQKAFLTEELSTSQKQAVIKLLEKNIEINWRPISILITDVKLISKALTKTIKKLLSSLISPNQTTYLENRFISERGWLKYDILKSDKYLEKA